MCRVLFYIASYLILISLWGGYDTYFVVFLKKMKLKDMPCLLAQVNELSGAVIRWDETQSPVCLTP